MVEDLGIINLPKIYNIVFHYVYDLGVFCRCLYSSLSLINRFAYEVFVLCFSDDGKGKNFVWEGQKSVFAKKE